MIGRFLCRFVWILVALWVCSPGLAQAPGTVLINEFMASNTKILANAGRYEDWIELYNASSQPVDVGGMYLTDDLTDPMKWPFPPGTILDSHAFLLVWADDNLQDPGLHTGFNLSSEGEELGLFDANGVLIDGARLRRAIGGRLVWTMAGRQRPLAIHGDVHPEEGQRAGLPGRGGRRGVQSGSRFL